jgi:hypothetical protein
MVNSSVWRIVPTIEHLPTPSRAADLTVAARAAAVTPPERPKERQKERQKAKGAASRPCDHQPGKFVKSEGLAGVPFELVTLAGWPDLPPPEKPDAFAENAAKALYAPRPPDR